MKKQTKTLITAVATVLVVLSVCLFAGKNSSESIGLNTDITEEKEAVDGVVQRKLSSAKTEGTAAEPESEIVLSVANDEEGENKEDKTEGKTEKETDMPEIPAESSEESAKSNLSETDEMISAVVQESTGAVSTEEQKTTATDTNTNSDTDTNMETGSESTKSSSTEESSSENYSGIDCSEYGIYGDTGEKMYYPCDEENYSFVVGKTCNPEFYRLKYSDVFYDEVLALSERFKKEHPFSEGSILKPYYPDIDAIYWFTGNFDKRYIVLEAYDTSHKGKFFLIEFTITDNYELDTVSIRELADDEVGE